MGLQGNLKSEWSVFRKSLMTTSTKIKDETDSIIWLAKQMEGIMQ
jgi:hypothetical protein